MEARVGILLEKRTLELTRRGLPTHERIGLYRLIALRGGPDVILFALDDLDPGARRVKGYVPTASGWRRVVAPMPEVIHKRVLFSSGIEWALRRMQRRGTRFINPPLMNDKARMHALLLRHPRVKDHLPLTDWYRPAELARWMDNGATAVLKPRIGSVGKGIVRLKPMDDKVVLTTEYASRPISRKQLRDRLAGRVQPGRYLIQQYIKLARYNGRPFDLRVPVQRNHYGEWVIAGIVAKVAVRHPFLTNLAQGGLAMPARQALSEAFSPMLADKIATDVERLAMDVAQGVVGRFPDAADLGLDIGVDERGKPWLIEVNTRDQRITFLQAGMQEAFHAVYEHPVAYCAYAMSQHGPVRAETKGAS